MKLLEAFRTATFRAAAATSAAFAVTTLLLFSFIFWQTAGYAQGQIDRFLLNEARVIAREPAERLVADVEGRFSEDLHRRTFAAIFTPDLGVIAGGLGSFPPGLPVDGAVHRARVRLTSLGGAEETVRAVAGRLADGRIVVVGRTEADLEALRMVVWRALALGLAPAVLFSLLAGALVSLRAMARVADLNRTIERIMGGDLNERLPRQATREPLDQLAASVNRMLDEIVRLIGEVQGVGDDIAHDLRTPLARARSRLEGGRARAATREELALAVDRAIGDLDQTFSMMTALLRIGQIESGRRREGFREVSLNAVAEEARELYQPAAELRSVRLTLRADAPMTVYGDPDLLFEAVANLVDNAVKFAPGGGQVRLSLVAGGSAPVVRVQDDGPGIPEAEHAVVMRRFWRADRSRRAGGSGLGLSIVAAILRLHEFSLAMGRVDDLFTVDVLCGPPPADQG